MALRRPRQSARATARPDGLLARALEIAVEQHLHEVAEAIVCALEAHARATSDPTRLDAVYLWLSGERATAIDRLPRSPPGRSRSPHRQRNP